MHFLRLAPLTLEHTPALYALTNANRKYLSRWLPWLDHVRSCDDTSAFITACMEEAALGGAPNFAIFHEDSLCGVAGFHTLHPRHRVGAIGYWLGESFTGKGLATESVRRLLKIGFDELGLNRIEIRCAVGNVKSRAIPERLGFNCEATLRECEWLYSRFVDHAIYALLESEYRAELHHFS
ncbi:MAG: GNAT family N-acetyltransferase [Pseudomonadota bacterium]|nr:GNAT family N-acetyltransferase [Pseudomonadota bacterium]